MILWLSSFFVSQIFAGIVIILDLCSFQFKERQKIIAFLLWATAANALHYLFLERYVWAAILWLWVLRLLTSYFKTGKNWAFLFIWLYIIVTAIFYEDAYDLIMLAGVTLSTISIFQADDKKLRLIMMLATCIVIIYTILIGSPMWTLMETMFLWSNIIGYYRHYISKKVKKWKKL